MSKPATQLVGEAVPPSFHVELVPNNGIICSAAAAAGWEAHASPLQCGLICSSSSLLHVASKRVQAVTPSMPALETETQKSSSVSTGSQQSQQPAPEQQQAESTQHSQQEEAGSAVVASPSTTSAAAPVTSPVLLDSSPLPQPPASLSPAPFEPPAPVMVTPPSSFLAPQSLAPSICPVVAQPTQAELERSVVETVSPTHSPLLLAPDSFSSSPTAVEPPGQQPPHSVTEAAAADTITQPSTLPKKPRRSLAEPNQMQSAEEQRDADSMTASTSVSVAQPQLTVTTQPLSAACSMTDTTAAPAAGVSELPAADTVASAAQSLVGRCGTGADTPLPKIGNAATEEKSQMLLRIGRGIASLDAATTLTSGTIQKESDTRIYTATGTSAQSTSQEDDIEEVNDDEVDRAAARRRSAKQVCRPNKRRIGANIEQRSMPRPNAPLIPFAPPPPPPSLAASLSVAHGVLHPSLTPSQPALLKPKPKRSVQQPLSQLLPAVTRTDSCSSSSSSAYDRTALTPSFPPLLPPPPPRPPLLFTDGGSAKRQQLEAGSFYSVDHTEATVADEQDEQTEQRQQQCATVRLEEQANDIRRLKAHNAQVTADNKQLRSKVSRLTEELRQLNQRLDRQGDSSERVQHTDRTIHMTLQQLQTFIDNRVSRQMPDGSGRRDSMDIDDR